MPILVVNTFEFATKPNGTEPVIGPSIPIAKSNASYMAAGSSSGSIRMNHGVFRQPSSELVLVQGALFALKIFDDERVARLVIVVHREAELLDVVDALDAAGRLAGRLHRRRQQRDQDRDDRDHHQ
jgi:hypothetical protein